MQGEDMGGAFLSSLTVAIPATVIPILIAAFAAYGFAWMRFPGRELLFAMVVALLVVPLQIALIPILRDYVSAGHQWHLPGASGWPIPALACRWRSTCCYNYISELPRDILEVGLHRWRVATYDLHPPDPAAVGAGAGLVRHLPVPLGLERLSGRADLPGQQPEDAGADDAAGRVSSARAGRTGTC